MAKVVCNMTVSLDGYVAGPNDGPENSLGDGGSRLFDWYFNGDTLLPIMDGQMNLKVSAQSAEILREELNAAGAGIWGRRTFDISRAWGGHPPTTPCFIITHRAPAEWLIKDSPFIFVSDGVKNAVERAKMAAGHKNVVISTASIFQQCLKLGLVDEVQIDLVPLMLGGGVRLFDNLDAQAVKLECVKCVKAPGVTHLRYRVI
ncbi:MAG: dihydrofolate reductase family protein [Anaerolineae bacterium]|nr:dihydrofolate reductase family protein [Anaerolineae bacterium]